VYNPLPNPTKEELASIADKIAAGLSREQAEQVILDQRNWDAHPENPKNAGATSTESAGAPEKGGKPKKGAKADGVEGDK
jgi:hypothetical protein